MAVTKSFRTQSGSPSESPRPRRRLLTPPSVAVLALATCAIGVFAGIHVEKSSVSSSAPAAGLATGSTSASRAASSSAGRGSGSSGAPPGSAGAAGGGVSIGTVTRVDGRTLVLREPSGETVKVKLGSATTISKSSKVDHRTVRPGDSVTITGRTTHDGTIAASSVSDSGDSSTGTGSASATSSSASSGSSAGSPLSSAG
jgi:Domain of unknown function (DUF5666)